MSEIKEITITDIDNKTLRKIANFYISYDTDKVVINCCRHIKAEEFDKKIISISKILSQLIIIVYGDSMEFNACISKNEDEEYWIDCHEGSIIINTDELLKVIDFLQTGLDILSDNEDYVDMEQLTFEYIEDKIEKSIGFCKRSTIRGKKINMNDNIQIITNIIDR